MSTLIEQTEEVDQRNRITRSRALCLDTALRVIKNVRTQWVFMRFMMARSPENTNQAHIERLALTFQDGILLRSLDEASKLLYHEANNF